MSTIRVRRYGTEGAWERLLERTSWRRMAWCLLLTATAALGATFTLPLFLAADNVIAGFLYGTGFGLAALFGGFWLAGATTPGQEGQ